MSGTIRPSAPPVRARPRLTARTHRLLALAASVAAALGASAVASTAQSPHLATTEAAIPEECLRPLPTPSGDQPPAFLNADGITGESTNTRHVGESDVDSFRVGANAGAAPGEPQPRALVIGKPYDKASPQLLDRLAKGATIPTVVISQDKSAGTFLRYVFTNVRVIDTEHTGRAARKAERLCLTFTKASVEYRAQKPDGTLDVPVRAQL